MEVDITDKGRDYYDKDVRDSDIDGNTLFDTMVLTELVSDGPLDIERTIASEERNIGPVHASSIKKAFRRLFEAGYIEEVPNV